MNVIELLQSKIGNADNIYFNTRVGGKIVQLPLSEVENQYEVAGFFIGVLEVYRAKLKTPAEPVEK